MSNCGIAEAVTEVLSGALVSPQPAGNLARGWFQCVSGHNERNRSDSGKALPGLVAAVALSEEEAAPIPAFPHVRGGRGVRHLPPTCRGKAGDGGSDAC